MKTLLPHRRQKDGDSGSQRAGGRFCLSGSGTSHTRRSLFRRARRGSLRKDLHASVADGATFSVMVGIGETFLPAFVLAMGMGEIAAGLVASIPLLVGSILQLISPLAVSRLGSNRRWVVICVLLQAASFLPLIAGALWGTMPVVAVFVVVSLYWGAGYGAGPAWNAWIDTLVPLHVRAPFFAWRSRASQAGVLVGFVAGGVALQYGKSSGQTLGAFACIFSIAACCRFLSARFLAKQSEHPAAHEAQRQVSLRELLARMRAGGSERMLLYFLAVQVAVQISGPYFTPYILGQLHVSYLDFMLLLATSFIAKIVALPACGRFAYRFGARRLVWLGGIGIIPVSGMWIYAHTFWQIVLIQFIAGVVWAAYELAMFLLFFETVRREERTCVLTLFNLGNAVALVVGALCGGALLKALGEHPEAYLTLFAVSSVVRASALFWLLLARNVDPVGETEPGATFAPVNLPEPATVNAPAE